MNWTDIAKKITIQMIEEIKFYINEGIDKEKAINMILDKSCIGTDYKQQVINYFKKDV
jgi:hypothetical protein